MPRSRIRRKNSRATARSRGARDRKIAEHFAPLDAVEQIEAERYFLEAIDAQAARLEAERAELQARLAALPSPAPLWSGSFERASTLENELGHIDDLLDDLATIREDVANRRAGPKPVGLVMLVVRGRSYALLAEAEADGAPVDAEAYAEAKHREALIGRWLMHATTPEGDPAGPVAGRPQGRIR